MSYGVKNNFGGMGNLLYLCFNKLPIMSYTKEQIKNISKIMKRHLSDKEFSCDGGSYNRFRYKVVPIISRDKYNNEFHFKIVVTKFENSRMVRGENGFVRDENGEYVREWRKCRGSKLTSHRHNYTLRNEIRNIPILKVFGIRWYVDVTKEKIKVEWAV